MKKQFLTFVTAAAFSAFMVSCGGGEATSSDKATTTDEVTEETTTETTETTTETTADFSAGKAVYEGKGTCLNCHGATGEGTPGVFPPLAKSDYLAGLSKNDIIKQTLYGATEPITVNGTQYPGSVMSASMNAVELTDQEVADVVNYVLNNFGNSLGTVTADEVKAVRK